MSDEMQGRNVVVTGAAGGLGTATAMTWHEPARA
jgi:NAD(P)-dependent dehydrogenase (short-subunit alcohol dehydrogenase family)